MSQLLLSLIVPCYLTPKAQTLLRLSLNSLNVVFHLNISMTTSTGAAPPSYEEVLSEGSVPVPSSSDYSQAVPNNQQMWHSVAVYNPKMIASQLKWLFKTPTKTILLRRSHLPFRHNRNRQIQGYSFLLWRDTIFRCQSYFVSEQWRYYLRINAIWDNCKWPLRRSVLCKERRKYLLLNWKFPLKSKTTLTNLMHHDVARLRSRLRL